jgi:diguanylate cyclase (GGDEF)-like protein
MAQYIYPPQHHELLSGLPWIASLARREYNVIAPLGTWLRDGNHGYDDIPPGLQNEVFFKDLNTGEIHSSALWRDWGWGDEDMQELAWLKKAHPEDRPHLIANVNNFENQGIKVGQTVYRVIDSENEYHWILSSAAAVLWEENGELFRYIGRDIDITSRLHREMGLKKELDDIEMRSARDRALIEAAGKIAGVTKPSELQEAMDAAAPEMLGMSGFRLVSMKDGIPQLLLGPNVSPPLHSSLKNFREGLMPGTQVASIPPADESEEFCIWYIGEIPEGPALAVFSSPGSCSGEYSRLMAALGPVILQAWNHINDLDELRRHATTDPLTGSWNRRPFLQQAGRRLRRNIEDGRTSAVALLDIDFFKRVNDRFGHTRGDRVISRVSDGMNAALRANDLMCRWGGEEFGVFLDDVDEDDAFAALERIRILAGKAGSEDPLVITLSAGVSMVPGLTANSMEDALRDADWALMDAKGSGRDKVCILHQKQSRTSSN